MQPFKGFRLSIVSLAALSLSVAACGPLAAQSEGHTRPSIVVADAMPADCPLILDVRHGAGLAAVHSVGGDKPTEDAGRNGIYAPDGQTLDLQIHNLARLEIASIDAIVAVDSGAMRMLPVDARLGGAKLPMHLTTAVGVNKDAAVSWRVASTNPVLYVEVTKVTYRDGSTWGSGDFSCRVTPNPLTLISSR